jgi:hypothetical protein
MINLVATGVANGMEINCYLGTHDSTIARIRNNIVKHVLENDYDYLLFIDSDVSFKVEDVFHMLTLAESTDMKIIVGAYPQKDIYLDSLFLAVKNGLIKEPKDLARFTSRFGFNFEVGEIERYKPKQPIELYEGSTGFMLISTEVLKEIVKAYPERIGRHPDNELFYSFFENTLNQKTKIFDSEDYYFCGLAKSLGYKVWLLPYIELQHVGTHHFTGNVEDYMLNV